MNALQTTNHGNLDAFVAKLNQTGNELVYSTYFGGNSDDIGNGIALDKNGYVFITGDTLSSDLPRSSVSKSANGNADAFIMKLAPSGNNLVYSTFLGGFNN